ncbi:hypothetical protein, partial [Pseudomonas aeruginosa]
ICFIGKLGGWGRGILPNQKVFFRVSLETFVRDRLDILKNFLYFTVFIFTFFRRKIHLLNGKR